MRFRLFALIPCLFFGFGSAAPAASMPDIDQALKCLFHSTDAGCAAGDASLALFDKPAAPPTPPLAPVVCDKHYPGPVCIWKEVSDVDCRDGLGNGPYYTPVHGKFHYLKHKENPDHYGIDKDDNGWACEDPYRGPVIFFLPERGE